MEARVIPITKADAEQAIREGKMTVSLRRQLEAAQKENAELRKALSDTQARLAMAHGIINRNNKAVVSRHRRALENGKKEKREQIGELIDMFILGMGAGAMLAIWLASWIVFRM